MSNDKRFFLWICVWLVVGQAAHAQPRPTPGRPATIGNTTAPDAPRPKLPWVPLPDPSEVAPPIDPTIPTTVFAATEFLYSGPNPIQVGVSPGTIVPSRVAVLRGRVLDRCGQPVSRVRVRVLGQQQYGWTFTRPRDGMFDLVVNGGGPLTLKFVKDGYLEVHRTPVAPLQDYLFLDDICVTTLDSQVTSIDLTSGRPIQCARGSISSDNDGNRQATLLFCQGTEATMRLPDGTSKPLSALNVRATEYTVGPDGPEAMPGGLPPTSAYTYCAEFTVDEAMAAGANTVEFSQPVYFYVENFLGFPVGGIVPTGSYDRVNGLWVGSDNGIVIAIVSISSGMANLDLDGDGQPEMAQAYADLGITEDERIASKRVPWKT